MVLFISLNESRQYLTGVRFAAEMLETYFGQQTDGLSCPKHEPFSFGVQGKQTMPLISSFFPQGVEVLSAFC